MTQSSSYWVESITILKALNSMGPPARFDKEVLFFGQMARPHSPHSPHYNSPLGREDELVEGLLRAPTKDSNTPTPSPADFQTQTPALAPALTPLFHKGLFQQFMKVFLEN